MLFKKSQDSILVIAESRHQPGRQLQQQEFRAHTRLFYAVQRCQVALSLRFNSKSFAHTRGCSTLYSNAKSLCHCCQVALSLQSDRKWSLSSPVPCVTRLPRLVIKRSVSVPRPPRDSIAIGWKMCVADISSYLARFRD